MLPTAPLGTTGMDITRVGFEAWAIGGAGWRYGWGPQDDAESVRTIRHAVEAGVNWIDTAAVYGLGHSEEVVAPALDGVPEGDRPFVFTKCGLVWDPQHPTEEPRLVGRPDSIRREVEDSLRRLRVERIDLYQMHWPAQDGSRVADYWAALLDLKAQGKVRAVGLSNHDVARLEAAEAIGHVDSLQPPFSAISRRAGAHEIPWCRGHGTGVIVYSPMQSACSPAGSARSGPGALARTTGAPGTRTSRGRGCGATSRSPTRCGSSPSGTRRRPPRSRSRGRSPGRA